MDLFNQPTGPTTLGKECDFPLGTFDAVTGSCTLVLTIPNVAKNYLGTVHGGWLAAVVDEAYGQLASFQYGLGSGGTRQLNVSFRAPARPGLHVTVRAWCVQEKAVGADFRATVHAGQTLLVESTTEWRFRQKFLLTLEQSLLPMGTRLVRAGVPHTVTRVLRRSDPGFLVVSTGYRRTATCPYIVRNEQTAEEYSITAAEALKSLHTA